ncbi:MAG TPA: flagellar basal body P-ring formation chaperone FlgA [Ideonella sp.]|jgi:flagella basal body P-ring formation protein FlgA|nr:flagellar basal body P-ring formation chaperone FlgA [Ideonella sp.]
MRPPLHHPHRRCGAPLVLASALAAAGAWAHGEGPLASPSNPLPAPPPMGASERWVGPTELFAAAERALAATLRTRAARIELAMPRDGLHGVVVDAGAIELVARPLASEWAWSPRMAVWVDVRQGGVVRRSVLVPVQVHAWQKGWIAERDLAAGAKLSADLLRADEVDVAAGGQAAWQGEPEGRVLRATVLAGRYLGAQQVTAPRAVTRGERVELVHQLGAVQVLAAANALQDGDQGQHIQVRVDGAQGAVLARVIEPGRVELLK